MKSNLSLKDQILFSVGGFGENVTFQAVSAWLFFFWSGRGDTSQALVPVGILGILLGIGRLIEAFDDPVIGYLSDQTKSKMGRRFPYVFFGAPLLALSFFLLWIPLGGNEITRAIYFFLAMQFFFFAYTLVSAPYEGILPEIAKTSKDRVTTSVWRVVFGVFGAAAGLVGSSFIIERFGFLQMGIILGIGAWLAFWVSILGIKRKLVRDVQKREINFKKAILATLSNRQFLVFSASLILFSMGLNLLTALLPFYVKVILGKPEGQVAIFSALVLVSMILALPIQTFFSRIWGKSRVYAYSMLILGLVFPVIALVGLVPFGEVFWQLVIVTILIGLPLSGQFVFPNAILADVIDYDEKLTGLRREAIYYGMQNTLQKMSFALSSLIFGTSLAVFGSSGDAQTGIRLIGPIAGLVTILGFVIFIKGYRLSEPE